MKSRFSRATHFIAATVSFTFLVTFILDSGSLAIASSSATSSGNAMGQLGQLAESAGPTRSFQTDLFTGRAQTSVPIFVPPGRKNVQPSLSLGYSSSSGNGWLGMGWGLDMGSIQRDTKNGIPKYDSTDKYIFSYQGVSSELVSMGTNEYRAKDEALFLKFVNDTSNNKWLVTDKSGTVHTFGDASGNRQTNALGTFKWALCKVKDTSGNYMTVSYNTDNGQLYLSTIEYNGNETQSFAHSHKVEFTLEDRNDDSFSYASGAKVSTIKRLNNIQVKVKDGAGAYQLARKYVLGYEYSAATTRSRLITVTEYGKDGTTSLPATTFVYQDKVLGFDSMTDKTNIQRNNTSTDVDDFIRSVSSAGETIVDVLDIDGDGINDRVEAVLNNTTWDVQAGNGSSFGSFSQFGAPYKPTSLSGYDYVSWVNTSKEQATDFVDIDGDGLPDRIIAQDNNTSWIVQLNTGSGFAGSNSSWGTISRMVANTHYDYIRYTPVWTEAGSETLVDFFDINGDGLPDRVMAAEGTNYWKVQLNTGSGFSSMQNWGTTERLNSTQAIDDVIRAVSNGSKTFVDVVDLNGDGLPDRVQGDHGFADYWKVQWNTGNGFTTMENWGPVERMDTSIERYYIRNFYSSGQQSVDLFDLNGDGLPDRVQAIDNNANWKVQWNTGTGFTSMQDFGPIEKMSTPVEYSYSRYIDSSGVQKVDVADLDGDGLPDRIQSLSGNTAWKVQKNKGPFPDLLKDIKNGRGGKTTIAYGTSTALDNTDTNGKKRLPFPIQVVTQVDQSDGMGNTVTTTYSYKGGMYDATEREFRGFREVTVTDAIGTKAIHTFDQSATKKGRLLEKEVRDSSNNLFAKDVNTWSVTNPYTGVNFVNLTQQDGYIYDGDGTSKQTRQTFTYDSYGNRASTTEEGDTLVSTDSRKTVNEYVYNTTNYILNTLKKTTLYDTDLSTVKAERYFYYDGATSITTTPTAGLLTKEEEWLSTASGCGSPGVCTNNPKTTMTYDGYGNVATVVDARSYTTTNTYDSTYHLFLTQISNALSQTKSFTYDAWFGLPLTSTDPNGQVTEKVYDTLGRTTKVIGPQDSSSEPTQEFSYNYPAAPDTVPATTKTTMKVKSSVPGQTFTQLITYSFTDGLGREVQRRSPAESGSDQSVSGIVTFNSRGLVDKQYVSYIATSSTSYVAPDTSKPKATFTYDAVGRRIKIDYPDSTNSQVAYSDFVKTTTDQRGKQLRYTNDAYGRLVKTEEFNSGSTYTTTYEYDVLNNLKKTTDNASNEITVSYDSLARKTAMTDPSMGSWTYVYDLNDNITSQTDAKSQTISFTYDALNRVTLKDLPSGETDVTYSYDSAPTSFSGQTGYWVGRLAKVSDASGDHEFKYDKQGRVISDKKTVSGTGYQFDKTYDSMGRVRTLTYPDTEVVTYTYNGAGEVETVSGLKSSVTTDYVKDVNYNASMQITFLKYGNNVTSDYTYNANTLRLGNILTKKPDGATKLQDLSYSFDNNGNVSAITDAVNSMSQTFTYDDLNRLTQAVGSAYGTEAFAYDSIGNMTSKAGRTMVYGEGAPGPHAVTTVSWTGSNYPSYCRDFPGSCGMGYDANGNMTTRGQDALAYDSENRLKEVKLREGTSGTTNYTLKSGWNVISFTHLPDNKAVSSVLSSLTFGTDYNQVSTWDSASGTWKHWVNDSNFNDFTEFQYGKTYEIYNNSGSDKSLAVTGTTNGADLTHNIVSGDNFISPAVKSATNITTVLSGLTLGTHYSDVKRFNATTQAWESSVGGAFTQFEPGKGYNIIGLTSASFSYGKTETITTFVYDSAGQRVKKIAGGTTTTYLGKDYDVTASTSSKYIFLGDKRISMKDSTGNLLFYHEDHINSSNVISDASGNQSALYEYDPYGATATHTGATDIKHQFTGKENDSSTKLYYYGARYYDPQLGRFITADWTITNSADPQAFNRYAYARNNPIIYTDPTGLNFLKKLGKAFKRSIGSFIGGTIGAVVGAFIGAVLFGAPGAIIGAYLGGSIGAGMGNAVQHGTNVWQGAVDGLVGGLQAAPFIAIGFALGGPPGAFAAAVAYSSGRTLLEGGSLEDAAINGIVTGTYSVAGYKISKTLGADKVVSKGLEINRSIKAPSTTSYQVKPDIELKIELDPLTRGRMSEVKVLEEIGLQKNTEVVSSPLGRSIPDAITQTTIIDIKDVKVVSFTRQLRIQADAARATGRTNIVITGRNSRVSKPLSEGATIERRDDIGPQ